MKIASVVLSLCVCAGVALAAVADSPVETPRKIPATRQEMKELLEDMKKRPNRVPLPEISEAEKAALGDRAGSYESRLRYLFVPTAEGTVFGAGQPRSGGPGAPSSDPKQGTAAAPRRDFTRNADENMTLTYQFKTMLFWIVARTNNCQYCLGHQEWKLSATGMTDDQIAALDADWTQYSEAEQAAFAYARLVTWEPHRLSDQVISSLQQHYTPFQILEMTMSMGGNNAINRWKEGIGIPQSAGNTFGSRAGASGPPATEHSDTFLTPTSDRFRDARSIVAPLEVLNGVPSGRGMSNRPRLESRSQVLTKLSEIEHRTPRIPMMEESQAARWLQDSGVELPVENWMRLIARFPNEARGRLPALASRERQTGDLSVLRKIQLNWIIARQDHAWYALGQAYRRLKALGQSDDQIFELDGNWNSFEPEAQAMFQFARNLAASPIAATDADAALLLHRTTPSVFVQTVNHVASCAWFDRVTEAAGLPLE